jgi:hypothetical protein
MIQAKVFINGATITATGYILLATSNNSFIGMQILALNVGGVGQFDLLVGTLCDMDAADTATVTVNVSGMAGNTADIPISVTNTYFSGYLAC